MKIYNLGGDCLIEIAAKLAEGGDELSFIEDVDLSSSDLSGAIFEKILFSLGNLEDAIVSGGRLHEVRLEGVWICGAKFEFASFFDVEIYASQAYGVIFSGSELRDVKFLGTNLSEADFSNATFKRVLFGRDNMGHETNLSGVDFTGANLEEARFDGAVYDDETCFPERFDPQKYAGLVYSN